MASFNTSGIEDIINQMSRLGIESGPVAEEMCIAACEEIKDAWKSSAEKHGLRDTGALIDSIDYKKKPTRAGDIIYNDILPKGKDAKGTSNAKKAFILNFGTHKIPPTYWVDEAEENAGSKVQERIERIWNDFLAKNK